MTKVKLFLLKTNVIEIYDTFAFDKNFFVNSIFHLE